MTVPNQSNADQPSGPPRESPANIGATSGGAASGGVASGDVVAPGPAVPGASPLPPTPRAVSPVVARRVWSEPRVFRWLVATVLLAVLAAYLCGMALYQWSVTRNIIVNGVPISARISKANGFERVGMRQEPTSIVELTYQHADREHVVSGQLVGRTEFVVIGEEIPIRINPSSPTQWTYRTTPPLVSHELAAPSLVLIPLLGVAVALVLSRKNLLNLWQRGVGAPAIIAAVRSSSVSPRRPIATCLVVDGERRLTVSFHLAPEQRRLKKQDVIQVLYLKSGQAVALTALDPSL